MTYKIGKGENKVSIGAQILLVIAIIIFIFLENKKVKFGAIGITLFLWIFGRYFLYSANTVSIIFAIIMICIGLALLVIEKRQKTKENKKESASNENLSLKIVSMLFPIVGLIVYAVNIVQNPKIAKECGKWALIGFCIGLVAIGIIVTCIYLA